MSPPTSFWRSRMDDNDDILALDLDVPPTDAAPLLERGLSAALNDVLHGFLQYLKLAKNAAAHTVRAYRADIAQFLGFVENHPELGPGALHRVQRAHARAFLAELQQGAYARTSLARKLASLRPFVRWSKRQA